MWKSDMKVLPIENEYFREGVMLQEERFLYSKYLSLHDHKRWTKMVVNSSTLKY